MLAGAGAALLPDYVVADDLAAGRAVRLLLEWKAVPVFGHQAFAIWLPHCYRPARARGTGLSCHKTKHNYWQ